MISYSTFEREYMDALEYCYVHDYSDDAIDMVLTCVRIILSIMLLLELREV